MKPIIIEGGCFTDERGTLSFNNSFDASAIKRLYTIENKEQRFVRGWQGHRIEQRWFSSMIGSFKIELIAVDNWDHPAAESIILSFMLEAGNMDILHVPPGYVSSIQALSEGAKLLVMADHTLGEVKDEYRFGINYFTRSL
jgi:dTDP-4-dehydrorhamnose 3,5-epimerase-like enzyme